MPPLGSGDHGGLAHPRALGNLGQGIDRADHVGEGNLRIHSEISRAGHITLQINADRGALGAGSRQANHYAAAGGGQRESVARTVQTLSLIHI